MVLITGASAGIGEMTARKLAAKGHDLILLARRKEKLDDLASQLKTQYPKIQILTASVDICDRQQVENFFQVHAQTLQNLKILINNAGLARGADKFQNSKVSDWDEMMQTNVTALLDMTRLALPIFLAKNEGHILNLGSVAGRWVYPGGAVYCASKHAVKAISEGLRLDLLGTNIRVTNIEPGMVETEFSQVRFRDQDKAKAVYKGMRPLTAEDIAETIEWTLSRPAHVNIQELVIYPTDQAAIRDVHRV